MSVTFPSTASPADTDQIWIIVDPVTLADAMSALAGDDHAAAMPGAPGDLTADGEQIGIIFDPTTLASVMGALGVDRR